MKVNFLNDTENRLYLNDTVAWKKVGKNRMKFLKRNLQTNLVKSILEEGI